MHREPETKTCRLRCWPTKHWVYAFVLAASMKRLIVKTNSASPNWVPAPPVRRPPASPQNQRWIYDRSRPASNFAPGFDKIKVLRDMANLFTLRSQVTSREEYDSLPALEFEDEIFLWSGRSRLTADRHCFHAPLFLSWAHRWCV